MLVKNTNDSGINRSKLLFLLIFCSFASFSSLVVNPVYIIGLMTIVLSILFFDFNNFNKVQLAYFIYFFTSLVNFTVGSYYFSEVDRNINYLSSILYLYCIILGGSVIHIATNLSLNCRKKVYLSIFNILIFFMSLELIVRIVFSGNTGSFYDYKISKFYQDSNFTSFVILFFMLFLLFLKNNNILNIGKLKFYVLLILLILTFSRASLFSFFACFVLITFAQRFIGYFSIILLISYGYISYVLVKIYNLGDNFLDVDGSFNSKFYLMKIAIDNYHNLPTINKIFGIGLNNFQYFADGRFAHNIFITFIYEFGFFGIFSFIGFMFFLYRKTGSNFFYIFLPFIIAGFSLFSAYMPFYFVLLSCLYVETNNRKSIGELS